MQVRVFFFSAVLLLQWKGGKMNEKKKQRCRDLGFVANEIAIALLFLVLFF